MLEAERKTIQTRTQELQSKRNALSKGIGQAKAKGEDTAPLMAEVAGLGDEVAACEKELEAVQAKLSDLLLGVPNVPHASVPVGKSSDDNVEVRRVGEPRKFDFAPKDHVDIGEGLGHARFRGRASRSPARASR